MLVRSHGWHIRTCLPLVACGVYRTVLFLSSHRDSKIETTMPVFYDAMRWIRVLVNVTVGGVIAGFAKHR